MHNAELRRRRGVRVALAGPVVLLDNAAERARQRLARLLEPVVVRPLAIGTPMALVLAGLGVEHDHAVIDVAVGDVQFVGVAIDDHVRRRAEVIRVVAAAALPLTADLHQELALAREREDLRIFLAAGSQPDTIAMIDVDAMLERGPPSALAP